ncbi:MAG TPA: CheR family methyltransferase [Abditibacteriaceae bacterium]|nr:CheR family methyltransferase [Abditibacteriaceae bacterium]
MSMSTAGDALAQLSEFVAARLGLHFPPERWADLERGVRRAASELGCEDVESCLRQLVAAPLSKAQVETLARHLTVGETYFWREKQSLEVLEAHILPHLVSARRDRPADQRTIRIWSAGCCTGEEPYSIAMLFSRLIPDPQHWNLTVLATDVNTEFLAKAATGIYREWSFRGAPPWLKEKYFQKTPEGHYQVVPHIRKMVSFAALNLAEDTYPSILNNTHVMDVILCRNVLIYLTAAHIRQVTQNFYRCLVDGGWLIVSPSETSHTLLSQFSTVNFPGTILYRKERQPRVLDSNPPRAITPAPLLPALPAPNGFASTAAPLEPNSSPLAGEVGRGGVMPRHEAGLAANRPSPSSRPHRSKDERGTVRTASEAVASPNLIAQARAYANDGQLAAALECCERVIAEDKMNPVGHYLHATILQEQGALAEATRALKRALYLDCDFVLAHFALGNVMRQQGKPKEARKHFENTLRLLRARHAEDALPESDGLTAGRLESIIMSMMPGGSTP